MVTTSKHRHAKRARVIFCDRSIRRTVYSNDLVKFLWLTCLQINVHTILLSNKQFDSFFDTTHSVIDVTRAHA